MNKCSDSSEGGGVRWRDAFRHSHRDIHKLDVDADTGAKTKKNTALVREAAKKVFF